MKFREYLPLSKDKLTFRVAKVVAPAILSGSMLLTGASGVYAQSLEAKVDVENNKENRGFWLFHPQEAGVLLSHGEKIDVPYAENVSGPYSYSSLTGTFRYNIEPVLDRFHINFPGRTFSMVELGASVGHKGNKGQAFIDFGLKHDFIYSENFSLSLIGKTGLGDFEHYYPDDQGTKVNAHLGVGIEIARRIKEKLKMVARIETEHASNGKKIHGKFKGNNHSINTLNVGVGLIWEF